MRINHIDHLVITTAYLADASTSTSGFSAWSIVQITDTTTFISLVGKSVYIR